MVGRMRSSSPRSWRASASAGLTHRLAMVSRSSCRGTCSGGAAATKNLVSYRRGAPSGVTQWPK